MSEPIDGGGERCVPWSRDTQMVYEHFHRYVFAADRADGLRVMDLASGEGYGCNLLSARAASVIGVELDEAALTHSRDRYQRPNLRFDHGSITELDRYEPGSADLITCFEAIEHVEDQAAVVRGAARILGDAGVLLISTPDRQFTEAEHLENPFHVHEMDRSEFRALLEREFRNVRLLLQSVTTGSRLLPELDDPNEPAGRDHFARRGIDGWEPCDRQPDPYVVAVASNGPLDPLGRSHLHDVHRELAWRPVEPDLRLSEEGLSPLEVERRILLRRLGEAYDEVAYWKSRYTGVVNSRGWRLVEKALDGRRQVRSVVSRIRR